jgi:type II secretory pathway pseudopilin PulG
MSESAFQSEARTGEQGFLLVGVIVMAALVLIALSVAAPVLAKDLQRERELEAIHRGQQYTRAIRLYYKKFNAYPTSVKALDGGAPQERFLRQHYLDPFTGKDDWRLIGVGQAKTTVKGFFGEPLGGLNSSGLGGASGMQSSGLGNTGGTTGGADSGNTGGAGSTSGAVGSPGGQSSFGQSSFGQNGSGSGSGGAFGSGSTGPFVGIGIPKDGASIVTLNEQSDYSTWEFIYDPRIEQLYAKSSIFGGGIATSSGGLGSASSLNGTPGASGTNPTTSGTPPTGTPPAGTPNSNTPTPNPGSPPQ